MKKKFKAMAQYYCVLLLATKFILPEMILIHFIAFGLCLLGMMALIAWFTNCHDGGVEPSVIMNEPMNLPKHSFLVSDEGLPILITGEARAVVLWLERFTNDANPSEVMRHAIYVYAHEVESLHEGARIALVRQDGSIVE